jgi:hypothetical protein
MSRVLSLASVLVTLAACPSREISKLDPLPATEVYKEIPVSSNREIDILFVVDNSDSMREEQQNLATNFPRFIQVLDSIEGGRPSVHLGVISSDLGIPPYAAEACTGNGDDGLLQNAPRIPGCSPPNGGARFLSDIPNPSGGRITNYNGALEDAFACIALLGKNGCGLEQHLESMRRALDPSNLTNTGFIRPEAYLAVIILADEDDCSARDNAIFNPARELDNINSPLGVFASFRCTEFGVTCDGLPSIPRAAGSYTTCHPRSDSYLHGVDEYVQFLFQLKGDPNLVAVAGIVGNPTPFNVIINSKAAPELGHSCSSTNLGVADPAVRLKAFFDGFGLNSRTTSICQDNLATAIEDIAKLVIEIIGTPCLGDAVKVNDIDPVAPGLQLDCQVYDKNKGANGTTIETVIARCPMVDDNTPVTTKVPCWWSNVDNSACMESATGLTLHVERGGADPVPTTRVVARCVAD